MPIKPWCTQLTRDQHWWNTWWFPKWARELYSIWTWRKECWPLLDRLFCCSRSHRSSPHRFCWEECSQVLDLCGQSFSHECELALWAVGTYMSEYWYAYLDLRFLDEFSLFLMDLYHIFKIVIKILKNNVLHKFSFFSFRIEQILNLNDMRTPLQHSQNLILPTHTLLHLLNSLQCNLPPIGSINRLENIA